MGWRGRKGVGLCDWHSAFTEQKCKGLP
jgi:hypothetical protein